MNVNAMPHQVSTNDNVRVQSNIQNSFDEFEKSMNVLGNEIASLDDSFNLFLRPANTDPRCVELKNHENDCNLSPIEIWISNQVSILSKCIDRIQDYKSRSVT